MIARVRLYLRRKKYRRGARLTRFVAFDIRRDVEVIDDSEISEGFVRARIRTWNVLYAINLGLQPDEPREVRVAIDQLWTWTGQPWGGQVPDDDLSRLPR